MDLMIGSTITGKPKMPRRTGKKRDCTTIAKRWKDDPSYRAAKQVHGWTLEYRIFLDYLNTVEFEHQARCHEEREEERSHNHREKMER